MLHLSWLDATLDVLAAQPVCGYAPGGPPATEPTALAALALAAAGRLSDAEPAIDYLNRCQNDDGSVGIRQREPAPGWPTAWAVLAWHVTNRAGRHDVRMARAVAWQLADRGVPLERSPELGHDTLLIGWSWATGTHSWVEPTALHVAALKAVGRGGHPRVRDGVAMLLDRQLPGGGCNYGNTFVLGQMLLPHVQPSGVSLLGLANESDTSGRVAKSLAWLARSIGPETTAPSLAWALLGLAAHGRRPPETDDWLARSAGQLAQRSPSPHKLALLALAAKGWPA
jgi:hypothetical protein